MNETLNETAAPATKRVICRCAIKGCKYVKAINVPTVTRRVNTFLRIVACEGTVMNIANEERCPNHPRNLMRVRIVQGTLNPDHVCDSRCTGAVGHNCECSCGGANHGANWL